MVALGLTTEKAGWSTVNTYSRSCANTFRTDTSFEPFTGTSKGPCGCGRRHAPWSLTRYSPPFPAELPEGCTTSTSSTPPRASGSKRTATFNSWPSQSAHAGALSCVDPTTSKNAGLPTEHVYVRGCRLKLRNVKVSVWLPPRGESKRKLGSEVGGNAVSAKLYLKVPSSRVRNSRSVSTDALPPPLTLVGVSASGRYSTWNVPSLFPAISPSRTSRTHGSAQLHHLSSPPSNVTGAWRGSGLSTVMRCRATCRSADSNPIVSVVVGTSTFTFTSWNMYSPVLGLVNVTVPPHGAPSLNAFTFSAYPADAPIPAGRSTVCVPSKLVDAPSVSPLKSMRTSKRCALGSQFRKGSVTVATRLAGVVTSTVLSASGALEVPLSLYMRAEPVGSAKKSDPSSDAPSTSTAAGGFCLSALTADVVEPASSSTSSSPSAATGATTAVVAAAAGMAAVVMHSGK
mmetsp:Transcript_22727/g.38388  ORF Transcript_22727/g.38388 Transcript_22727/m.38388 type:complete len:457 (-) Transcript_22727:827-2197(-)